MKQHISLTLTLMLGAGLLAGALTPAHASYIDPGSAGFLFQLAIAGFMGGLYTVRRWMLKRRESVRARAIAPKKTESQHKMSGIAC